MNITDSAEPTPSPKKPSPKTSAANADDWSKLIIPKKINRSKISQMAKEIPGIMKTARNDLKKIKESFDKKKEIGIFPHEDSWNGASIEEIV